MISDDASIESYTINDKVKIEMGVKIEDELFSKEFQGNLINTIKINFEFLLEQGLKHILIQKN